MVFTIVRVVCLLKARVMLRPPYGLALAQEQLKLTKKEAPVPREFDQIKTQLRCKVRYVPKGAAKCQSEKT